MICPLVFLISSYSTPFSLAIACASSSVLIVLKSTPVTSFIASIIDIFFQPGAKFISFPSYSIVVLPNTFCATVDINCSAVCIISL